MSGGGIFGEVLMGSRGYESGDESMSCTDSSCEMHMSFLMSDDSLLAC